MATYSHTKYTENLVRPIVKEEIVAMRVGVKRLTTYKIPTKPLINLTYPQLKVMSRLYHEMVKSGRQGTIDDMEKRSLRKQQLETTQPLISRLIKKGLITRLPNTNRYAITNRGADEYEFQWYVANNHRFNKEKNDDEMAMESSFTGIHTANRKKLTSDEVREIRRITTKSVTELSEIYGVSRSTIWNIQNYRSYTDII